MPRKKIYTFGNWDSYAFHSLLLGESRITLSNVEEIESRGSASGDAGPMPHLRPPPLRSHAFYSFFKILLFKASSRDCIVSSITLY